MVSGIASRDVFSSLLVLSVIPIIGLLVAGPARAAGPAFVQVVASQPQTAQSTVTAKFALAQSAGDTNVLAIGWGLRRLAAATMRVITNPDTDIAEDEVVTATGTYSASAAQSGDEVMQVVAFKAAGQ
jgi:hypothetical protein